MPSLSSSSKIYNPDKSFKGSQETMTSSIISLPSQSLSSGYLRSRDNNDEWYWQGQKHSSIENYPFDSTQTLSDPATNNFTNYEGHTFNKTHSLETWNVSSIKCSTTKQVSLDNIHEPSSRGVQVNQIISKVISDFPSVQIYHDHIIKPILVHVSQPTPRCSVSAHSPDPLQSENWDDTQRETQIIHSNYASTQSNLNSGNSNRRRRIKSNSSSILSKSSKEDRDKMDRNKLIDELSHSSSLTGLLFKAAKWTGLISQEPLSVETVEFECPASDAFHFHDFYQYQNTSNYFDVDETVDMDHDAFYGRTSKYLDHELNQYNLNTNFTATQSIYLNISTKSNPASQSKSLLSSNTSLQNILVPKWITHLETLHFLIPLIFESSHSSEGCLVDGDNATELDSFAQGKLVPLLPKPPKDMQSWHLWCSGQAQFGTNGYADLYDLDADNVDVNTGEDHNDENSGWWDEIKWGMDDEEMSSKEKLSILLSQEGQDMDDEANTNNFSKNENIPVVLIDGMKSVRMEITKSSFEQ